MRLRRGILLAGGLLLLYSILIFSQGPGSKDTAIQGASDSSGPKGTMAFVRTLHACQINSELWEHPPVLLAGQSSTFLSIEPDTSVYPLKQALAVLAYAKSGHHVIWVTDRQDEFLKALGAKIQASTNLLSKRERTITGPNLPNGVEAISFSSNVTIGVLPKTRGILRYEDNNHDVLGAVIPVGTGDVSVWVVPGLFENDGIGKAQNFAIPFALVNQSPLLIDEFGHGVEQGTLFQTIFGNGRQFSFVFLVISAILYLWSASVRLGSSKRAFDDKPRHSGELLDALAWHFSKSQMYKGMFVIAKKAVRKRICTLVACHPATDWRLLDTYVDKMLSADIQGVYHAWRMVTENIATLKTRKLKKYNELTRKLISALDRAKKNV